MKFSLIAWIVLMHFPLIANSSCPLCEIHRAYNKEHPGEYEYYEDYLNAQKNGKSPNKETLKKADEQSNNRKRPDN